MMGKKSLKGASQGTSAAVDVSDVFSTYVYTGTGAAQDIVNGIDLATDGGMVWIKGRTSNSHCLFDTERGNTKKLYTNTTGAESTTANGITAFNADGFSLGSDGETNGLSPFASWTFKNHTRFFQAIKYTGNGVAGREIAHELGCEVGMMVVKPTSVPDNWFTYDRSSGATKYMRLNSTGANQINTAFWNDTEPTDSVFTIGTGINGDGREYIAYLFAHSPVAD